MSEREKTPVNNYANKHSHLYIFHAYHFIAVLQHWCRVSRVKETENQKDSGLPEVPQWWIKNRHPDLQRGNLTCVLLPLKWTRERMKTDRPHRLGFMKPATLFFPNTGKMGAWSTCLLFHSSSRGSFGEDALVKGERSMAALTEVFSCGLRRTRHSSRAVIYLSYLRHCPQ